jgi:dTDP-4-dehydrorhamnose 3,5-epimerase
MRELSVPGAWLNPPEGPHRFARRPARGLPGGGRRRRHRTPAGRGPGNVCMTRRGAIRGVHYADAPPGKTKYVSCLRGRSRRDRPPAHRLAVLRAVGRGRAERGEPPVRPPRRGARARPDGADGIVGRDVPVFRAVHARARARRPPLDPALSLPWPADIPVPLSDRDAAAPTPAEAARRGVLPRYDTC